MNALNDNASVACLLDGVLGGITARVDPFTFCANVQMNWLPGEA